MKKSPIGFLVLFVVAGCSGEAPVEPSEEVKNGPKLSKEQAEQYRSIIPGNKKGQQAGSQSPQ